MMRRTRSAAAFALALVAALFLAVPTASAGTSKLAYSWHVADDFLEAAVGSPPWAIAEAPSGDVIMLDGTGLLDVAAKTASGGGRFVHLAPDGSTVAEGTFTADGLVSFQFYGCGGPGGEDFLCGGLAKLDVTLTPDGTTLEFPATLWIDCLLGDKIPSDGEPPRAEGIRLNVKGLLNFNHTHEHSGFTVFIEE
jgi:hypothetical protein